MKVGAIGLLIEYQNKNTQMDAYAKRLSRGELTHEEIVAFTDGIREWNEDFLLRVAKEIERNNADGCCVENPAVNHRCINCGRYIE